MDLTKHTRVAATVACLALLGSMAVGGGVAGAAKKGKKRKGPTTVRVSDGKARAIPDAIDGGTTTIWGSLPTSLNVSKRFKGARVGDVQVSLRTTGLSIDAAEDLVFRVQAPNGRTIALGAGFSGQSVGPLTVTANSRARPCGAPPCGDPDATLSPPYFGTLGDPNLALLEGVGMSGRWVVTAYDTGTTPTSTSVLNSVGLRIVPQGATGG